MGGKGVYKVAISVIIDGDGIRVVESAEGERRNRPGRGRSLLSLLDDYVSLDLETTGFSPEYSEIIEVACIRYRCGAEVDSFATLVKPAIWAQ